MHAGCQKDVSQEWIRVLNDNFQTMSKGEDQLTKKQCGHATANTTTTATTTAPTTAWIKITIKAKSTTIKILGSVEGKLN